MNVFKMRIQIPVFYYFIWSEILNLLSGHLKFKFFFFIDYAISINLNYNLFLLRLWITSSGQSLLLILLLLISSDFILLLLLLFLYSPPWLMPLADKYSNTHVVYRNFFHSFFYLKHIFQCCIHRVNRIVD